MSKDGYLIFDTDTHVGPSMDVLETYMSEADRARLEPFADSRSVAKRTGQVTYRMGARETVGFCQSVYNSRSAPRGPRRRCTLKSSGQG